MLRHSYKVELKRSQAEMLGYQLDLKKNPENKRAKEGLEMVEKQIAWLKERIKNGQDPGCRNL